MKLSFLFWNIRGGERPALLSSLTRLAKKGIDIFVFAEGPSDPRITLDALNGNRGGPYYQVASLNRRILFFSRLGEALWTDRIFDAMESDRIAAQELQTSGMATLLIVGAHLDSPAVIGSEKGRSEWARRVASDVRKIERDSGHNRTILVGDLNMNPFEGGLIETSALHAVMSRELAVSVANLKTRRQYPAFYNPMWSCYGDRHSNPVNHLSSTHRPPATYFFSNVHDPANHFWNMYDQVLLRPSIMDNLITLKILDSDGEEPLVTRGGRPRARMVTDHLPIFFELEI